MSTFRLADKSLISLASNDKILTEDTSNSDTVGYSTPAGISTYLESNFYTETEIDTWRASTTVTEMGYLHGVSSDVQTQIDGKSATAHTHDGRYYTETEIDTWRNSVSQAEMGYVAGITSDIQTQIDTKMADLSDDLSPDLGGDMGCGGYDLDNIGKICATDFSTRICNQTGSTLTKGTAVTTSGLCDEVCGICKSDNREFQCMPACGVVYADITNGSEGCMITKGRINMDTSVMTGDEGDRLYVQADGSLDTAIPTSGGVQRVGFLVKKAASNAGRICICLRGRSSIYAAKDEHPILRMGSGAGHTKIEFKDYTNNEIMTIDSSGNLTLSGTVDGIDVANHNHDGRYYTETEIDTWRNSTTQTEMGYVHGITSDVQTQIDTKASTASQTTLSGNLQTNIDGKSDTGHTHTEAEISDLDHDAVKIRGRDISSTDTPNNGESITWNTANSEWRYTMISGGSGGSSNHSELNELDYASAGHTGFASTASQTTLSGSLQTGIDAKADSSHTHDDRYYTETELNAGQLDTLYYTEAEVDTISGALSAEIDSDISTHSSSADHDGRYYTETEVDSWRNSVTQTEMDYVHGVTSDIQTQISTHSHDNIYYTETEVDTWRASTTVTEMGYVHGVTSDIQTQIDTKASTASQTTLSGNLQTNIDAKADTSLLAIPASDHIAEGPQTNDIAAGESVTIISCVYLKSDGEWWKTDANASATASGMLAISLETKTDGQAMNVALPGSFVRDDTWDWTVGGEIYLSGTAGELTQTAPSATDDVVRIAGHATHADRMFFNPEQTIVVHA